MKNTASAKKNKLTRLVNDDTRQQVMALLYGPVAVDLVHMTLAQSGKTEAFLAASIIGYALSLYDTEESITATLQEDGLWGLTFDAEGQTLILANVSEDGMAHSDVLFVTLNGEPADPAVAMLCRSSAPVHVVSHH